MREAAARAARPAAGRRREVAAAEALSLAETAEASAAAAMEARLAGLRFVGCGGRLRSLSFPAAEPEARRLIVVVCGGLSRPFPGVEPEARLLEVCCGGLCLPFPGVEPEAWPPEVCCGGSPGSGCAFRIILSFSVAVSVSVSFRGGVVGPDHLPTRGGETVALSAAPCCARSRPHESSDTVRLTVCVTAERVCVIAVTPHLHATEWHVGQRRRRVEAPWLPPPVAMLLRVVPHRQAVWWHDVHRVIEASV